MNNKREMLRHNLATLAYRAAKVLRDVPPDFATYRSSETTRTPGQILAHLGDLLDWALSLAAGRQVWINSEVLLWEQGMDRFFTSLKKFDDYLASGDDLQASEEQLFQGPVADALTHVGQIGMLRRMAGAPVRGENYFVADIEAGSVSAAQRPARREFD
ncbi:MAG TPA: hypothetical protein VE135_10570 [Pyrinomonadaceae bacterium]|nr:hypothetical protein [Pyrinomonadaceae bacterium]